MNFRNTFLLAAPIFFLACGNANQDPTATGHDADVDALAEQVAAITGRPVAEVRDELATTAVAEAPATKGLRKYTVYSEQYKVPQSYIQLPAHWKVEGMETGYWSATAPNGLRVKSNKMVSFTDITGPLRQYALQAGQKLRAPLMPEQVLEQEVAPKLRSEGYELVEQKPTPDLVRKAREDASKMYRPQGFNPDFRQILSIWRKGDQRKAVFLGWLRNDSDGFIQWAYGTATVDAPAKYFETELNSFVQATLTAQVAPEALAAHKEQMQRQERQMQMQNQQSWAAHNQRMRDRWAAFNAQQAIHNDMVNSVNNSQMGAYNSTMSTMDNMQNSTINAIRGEQDAYNPFTGESGKIQSGYDNYWMNSDGQYFGTNDVMYDPNVNGDWTGQWQQVPTQP